MNVWKKLARTHCGSNGLGPERDRTLYISVSELIFYVFSLYVMYFSFSSPVLSLHTKKCFSLISLILRIFVWTWTFCNILVRSESFLHKGRSSPNLFISIQTDEHLIHVRFKCSSWRDCMYAREEDGLLQVASLVWTRFLILVLQVILTCEVFCVTRGGPKQESGLRKNCKILAWAKLAWKLFSFLSYLCSGAAAVPPSYLAL